MTGQERAARPANSGIVRATCRSCVVALAALVGAAVSFAGDVRAATPPTVGAYYYGWYGPEGRHWDLGYLRSRLSTPHRPVLGEYDSRSSVTISTHYAWAQRYGVDVFISSWWGPNGYDDVTVRDHLLPSPARGPTRVALLYESIARLGPRTGLALRFDASTRARLLADFDYLARTYFRHPGYYRIGGRPVVFLYVSRIYRGAYAQAITAVRAHVLKRYRQRIYLVGDEVDFDAPPNPARIRLFDAITPYTMYTPSQAWTGWGASADRLLGAVRRKYVLYRSVARRAGVRFIPNAQPAFNDRGFRLEDNHYALPQDFGGPRGGVSFFARFLAVARSFVDPRVNALTVTSWNEWHEDSQIEPTAPAEPTASPHERTGGYTYHSYGFGLLELLARFKASYRP